MNPLTDPEEFQKWKSHKMTKPFLQYLKDRRSALMEAWGRGKLLDPEFQPMAKLLGELADLRCNNIRDFYDIKLIEEVEE